MISSFGFFSSSPWMNTSGSLGFVPPAGGWTWPEAAAVFVTNPISFAPRSPAENRAVLPYPGGFLLHTGLPNPGLRAVIRQYAVRWARLDIPVWVHLIGEQPGELAEMVRKIESLENVQAVEISLPPHAKPEMVHNLVDAGLGELPLLVAVPLDQYSESWVGNLAFWGASAITLCAPRGTLVQTNGSRISGRVDGPALLPQALYAIQRLASQDLPVLAAAGITTPPDGQAALNCGATACQVGSALWKIR